MSTNLAQACLVVLNCVSSSGYNPNYLHSVNIEPTGAVTVKWDGVWNDFTKERLVSCFVPTTKQKLSCEFHNDPDKEWVSPLN